MAPSVSILNPPGNSPPNAVALRLNSEVLSTLRQLHLSGVVPKLVVKDGQFSIKVSDSLVYPCSSSNESLRFDIYNPAGPANYAFAGTVTERLNVLSDPRQIKEHLKTPSATTKAAGSASAPPTPSNSLPEKPVFGDLPKKSSLTHHPNPYAVAASDSKATATAKFLALLALGPSTKKEVEARLYGSNRASAPDLGPLFTAHTQTYNPNSTFTEADTYPSMALGLTQIGPENTENYVILKDKAYKELRPWQNTWFTPYERSLVIENAHHALSRLGYSDTHPLRRRITEKSSEDDAKKAVPLGGGMLSGYNSKTPGSPHISPGKRSATASPRLEPETKRRKPKNDDSPLKPAEKKFVASSSSSSSEDEKSSRRKRDGKRSNSSGSNTSNVSNTSNNSTFSSGASYTSPSSINEEHNDVEHSDDDMKLSSLARNSPAFPPKPVASSAPSSSHSHGDKRQQHYKQLAQNFYTKYSEYKELHDSLLRTSKSGSVQEKKRKVMKLFEMHNLLAGWKRKIWDFHNESSMAQGIMHLSRHKKTNSGGGSASVPSSSVLSSQERFQRSGTSSPSVSYSDRFAANKPAGKRMLESRSPRPKVALDY